MMDNGFDENEHCLIKKQIISERSMMEELEEGHFTLTDPLVKLDPYGTSPLAAVILFKTDTQTSITLTVRGKKRAGDITHTFPSGKTHVLPVLGLYPDFENTVVIKAYQGEVSTVKILTKPLQGVLPELVHIKATPEHLKSDLIIVSPPSDGFVAGFDYMGEIRWYLSVSMRIAIKRVKNGRLLIGTEKLIAPPYFMSGLYEIDMVGKVYTEYDISGGYHHDQFEMPNGDILVLTEDLNRGTVEDMLVLVDRESGEIKKTWDFKNFITPGDGRSGHYTEEDWFHNNAVWYDENTDSILLSGRHIDAIVNIDFESGKLNWILGDPETWPEQYKKYFFTPVGDNFRWQYAQHSCLLTPCGDVMCFDNGTLGSKIKAEYVSNKDNYSRGVRYRINTESMTIEQVWEFGKELGREFFSQHVSNVEYYGEGNYLLHSGGQQFVNETPSEAIIPFSTSDAANRCESITIEVFNNEIVLELRVKRNYYRATKLPLYYSGENLTLDEAW